MRRFFDTRSRSMRITSVLLILLLLVDIFNPLALAQSIGPGQADNSVYSPTGSSEMVDLFTGDFNYSIPVMDVDGYPISLSYNGDVKMDQDASWVGLGWSLNAGNLSRHVRGLPDDFKGDSLTEVMNIKDVEDQASEAGAQIEATLPITAIIDKVIDIASAGTSSPSPVIEYVLTISAGLNAKGAVNMGQHNYNGSYIDLNFDASYNLNLTLFPFGPLSPGLIHGNGLGMTLSSRTGIGLNPSSTTGATVGVSVAPGTGYSQTGVKSTGASYSTRAGLSQISITQNTTRTVTAPFTSVSTSDAGTSYMFPGTSSYTPFSPSSRVSFGVNSISKKGPMDPSTLVRLYGINNATAFKDLAETGEVKNAGYGYLHHQDVQYDAEAINQVMDFNRGLQTFHVPQTLPRLAYGYQTNDVYMASGPGLMHTFRPFRNDVGHVFDPLKTISGSNNTEFVRIARSQHGEAVGKPLGKAISAAGNLLFDIPPLVDNFIKEGGFFPPVDYEYGNGTGEKYNRFGLWNTDDGNTAPQFVASKVLHPRYEPVFFKAMGETNYRSELDFNRVGGFDPLAGEVKVDKHPTPIVSTVEVDKIPFFRQVNGPENRNTHFSYLDAEHAANYALDKQIKSYSLNDDTKTYTTTSWSRTSGNYQPHHLSEFTVLSNGSRYVYGIPNYSNFSKEVTFNVGASETGLPALPYDSCSMIVEYIPGLDNGEANNRGKDHFFKSIETPAHAEGNLLTAVLSPDYVDRTGDGPTLDDAGTYSKINYTRVHSDYKWRYPYSEGDPLSNSGNTGDGFPKAAYSRGFQSIEHDNRASYTYGEKEIWYIHSIESKNKIALFFLKDREDGHGVEGENGERDQSRPLKKLVKIELHDRKELEENGNQSVPLKTVNFEYDYSLCDNTPTNTGLPDPDGTLNQGGKLTLKKVYFTYGSSAKGRLSPYSFSYGGNYDYQSGAVDRWGNYKPQQCSVLPNQEYPYPEQDTALANAYASAWKLETVTLPSGGQINIQYEADDYAYVQDKVPSQLVQVSGFGRDEDYTNATTSLYNWQSQFNGKEYKPNNYIYFELEEPYPTGTSAQKLKDEYLGDMDYLYFKSQVMVTPKGDYEFVPGYAAIEDAGLSTASGGFHTHGWIKMKEVPVIDDDEDAPELSGFLDLVLGQLQGNSGTMTNPISKAGWQLVRKNINEHLYPQLNCTTPQFTSGALGFVASTQTSSPLASVNPFAFIATFNCLKQYLQSSFGLDWAALTKGGLNMALYDKGYSYKADLSKTFIKLHVPDHRKIGGNYRVKQITATDGWSGMGGSSDQVYGQTYSYEMTDENGERITSGVATSEPRIGAEDSPFRVPLFYAEDNILYPDDHHYTDQPPGEDLFPAPNVGYRRVLVQNLERQDVTRTATGFKVYEFFTAKDYPIHYEATEKDAKILTTEPDLSMRSMAAIEGFQAHEDLTIDIFGASQGYVLVLNNMHGKPRARSIYNESASLKNEVRYSYFEEEQGWDDGSGARLKNTVTAYDSISNKSSDMLMGVDFDLTVDMRKSTETSKSSLKTQYLKIALAFGIGSTSQNENIKKEFASMVGLKVIHQYGILKKTEIKDGSSTIVQENVAFDKNTGQPLLVRVSNDHSNWIYNFSYPAYWMYRGMSGAYINQGLELAEDPFLFVDASGLIDQSYKQYFFPGDEIAVRDLGTMTLYPDRYWIVQNETNNGYYLVGRDGTVPSFLSSGSRSYRIIRSGRRNMQFASAGSLTSRVQPGNYVGVQDSVLNATAQKFSDRWQMYGAKDSAQATAPGSSPDFNDLTDFLNAVYLNGDIGTTPVGAGSTSDLISLAGYAYYPIFSTAFANWQTCNDIQLRVNTFNSGSYVTKDFSLFCTSTATSFVLATNIDDSDFPTGQTHDSIAFFSNASQAGCSGSCQYDLLVHFINGDTATIQTSESDFNPAALCFDGQGFCGPEIGDEVNPYIEGVRGNYRPTSSYVYYSDNARTASDLVNTRTNGQYNFARFWRFHGGAWRRIDASSHPQNEAAGIPQDWLLVNDVTRCDPHGNALESKDALGLYAANLYGYNYTMSTASAVNSEYRQLAFDGFEDYDYYQDTCDRSHLSFYPHRGLVSGRHAHTGRYSMALSAGDSVSVLRSLTPHIDATNNPGIPFKLRRQELAGVFAPYNINGVPEKYVVSYWVKEGDLPGTESTYDSEVQIEVDCEYLTPESTQRSNIIDGWQRVEHVIEMPAGASQYISVELQNNHDTEDAYFDDLRIHPFRAAMQSMVYEPNTMRLLAVLDDRNFATFYEYDREGKLVIVKKETERGIFTLNEVRNASAK